MNLFSSPKRLHHGISPGAYTTDVLPTFPRIRQGAIVAPFSGVIAWLLHLLGFFPAVGHLRMPEMSAFPLLFVRGFGRCCPSGRIAIASYFDSRCSDTTNVILIGSVPIFSSLPRYSLEINTSPPSWRSRSCSPIHTAPCFRCGARTISS